MPNTFPPNPTLKPLSVLIGNWTTLGTHPQMPGQTLPGKTTFEWMEGGAFLAIRSEMEDKAFPKGIAILSGDDITGEGAMLYYDDRGVSRNCGWSFADNTLQWWRNAPGFSQRYVLSLADNGNTIIGKGELCKDGINWEPDLDLTYTRV